MEELDIKKSWKRTFSIIFTGQIFSILSSSIVQFAIIWFLTKETGSAAVLSIATIVGLLPQIILGPFIGVYIDRVDRKKVMIFSDLFIALTSLALGIFFYISKPELIVIYIVLGLRSVGSAFHMPSMQAVTPLLAPEDKMVKIAGISQAIFSISNILGPIFAGILFAVLNMYQIILLDVIGAIMAVTSLLFVKIPNVKSMSNEKPRVFHEMMEGLKDIKANKLLFTLTIYIAIVIIIYMPVGALFPLMTNNYFKLDAVHASIVETFFAVGMLVGGLCLSIWGGFKKKQYTILVSTIIFGIALTATGLLNTNGYVFFVIFSAILGLMVPFFSGMYDAIIQINIKPEMLGRVFAFVTSIMLLGTPIGLIICAPIAEIVGIQNWFLISGILIVVISLLMFNVRIIREEE